MLKNYLKAIAEISERGEAREESYYSTLEALLKQRLDSLSEKKLFIVALPKKTEAGNPDFRIWDGRRKITGYIEAKAPEIENLDAVENSEQLKRYRETFPNLILTNFYEFRLYRNGELQEKVTIGRPFIGNKLKVGAPPENEAAFEKLLSKFLSFSLPKIFDSVALAKELAKRTRFLKDEAVARELEDGSASKKSQIWSFYDAFNSYLINGISKKEFADLYSQTITYGLFAARTRAGEDFSRTIAYEKIPRTIGVLRDIFRFVSLGDLPKQMEWIIDDISETLAITDVKKILNEYFHQGKGLDPIVHFYETFLAEYDPDLREIRGVYYTPEPVVSYIVRSVHELLKEQFGINDGLAGENVTALDPAAGTLTFLAEAAKTAVEEFVGKYGEGAKDDFIADHILKNFYAFELMMAPYAVGHLKMSFLLEELGYSLKEDERVKLYLTNSLDMKELEQTSLPGVSSLSEESHSAGEIKRDKPILVILGNPPYSGHSANNGEWILKEIKEYYKVDGKPLKEKNTKWLQDDYVKFIRFAQWKIDRAGEGVLGFITNHAYLDNPTFRGMRRSLMSSFNDIYILDLHGNSQRKEKTPEGGKDENVFVIRQGVAIVLMVKRKKRNDKCNVFRADLWGTKENKYDWLSSHSLKKTKWKKIDPKSDLYLFIARDERNLKAYEKYPKIPEIFPVNSVGIVTARDDLTIGFTPEEVWRTVSRFSKMQPELARTAYNLNQDAEDWKVELAQKDLLESGLKKDCIVPILYRPFDVRYTYYTGNSQGFHCRPRKKVMQHMIKENIGLVSVRQVAEKYFNHVFIASNIIESRVTLSNKGIAYIYPLYLYPDGKLPEGLFDYDNGRRPNISEAVMNKLLEIYGAEFSMTKPSKPKKRLAPEDILNYTYAVLFSNIYREKYAGFLRLDFPRIPFPKTRILFDKVAALGKKLCQIHLLDFGEFKPISKFQGKGENKIEKILYDKKQKRIYFNDSQYFEGIKEDIWKYQIGGYQVLDKWLKERKERILSLEEVKSFLKIISALTMTIKIQAEIDKYFPEVEKAAIDFL